MTAFYPSVPRQESDNFPKDFVTLIVYVGYYKI